MSAPDWSGLPNAESRTLHFDSPRRALRGHAKQRLVEFAHMDAESALRAEKLYAHGMILASRSFQEILPRRRGLSALSSESSVVTCFRMYDTPPRNSSILDPEQARVAEISDVREGKKSPPWTAGLRNDCRFRGFPFD